ncbi:MAG: site-specific integrase, partial [Actinomycetota bacterium]
MRKGETLGLRWKDVDLERGHLTVNQTLISVGYQLRFGTPKSFSGGRTLDLDAKTVHILRAHRTKQSEERLAWGPTYVDSGLVFTRENGELIHPDAFGRAFKRLVRESGVSPIRFHDCRCTCASLALQAGVNILVVSKRLGHASVSFTLDTYGHEMPGQQQDAADRVAAIFMEL